MNRRTNLKYIAGLTAATGLGMTPWNSDRVNTRKIPTSGEELPIVGLGTWLTFDVGTTAAERRPLAAVVKALVGLGGKVIDSSPMYGRSETTIGDLCTELKLSDKIFGATKVWTSGKEDGITQMDRSMSRMGQTPMDLMQVHNLVDWKVHLNTLFDWKEKGKIRYVGITHYQQSAYGRMEQIIKNYPLDFIQVNYSVTSSTSGESLLPMAMSRGIAVIINRPYEGGSLFRRMGNKPLPKWASEINCNSWAQYFLKFILANPAVTCVIPGTSREDHLRENLGVAMRRLPDQKQQQKMLAYIKSL